MRDSPCIAVCTTLYDTVCRGCGRSDVEVSQWVTYSQAMKDAVMAKLDLQKIVVDAGLSWQQIDDLYRRYQDPSRHYHNWDHVAHGLTLMKGLASSDQIIAWAFHDSVYDPTRSDNEYQSAELAKSFGIRSERILTMIKDTKTHYPSIEQSKLVLDVDLSSLAFIPEQFQANRESIRKEYAHLTDEQFEVGTHMFAQSLLDRDRIFQTEEFAGLESLARSNLKGLICR